jgi:hypothetical protein
MASAPRGKKFLRWSHGFLDVAGSALSASWETPHSVDFASDSFGSCHDAPRAGDAFSRNHAGCKVHNLELDAFLLRIPHAATAGCLRRRIIDIRWLGIGIFLKFAISKKRFFQTGLNDIRHL